MNQVIDYSTFELGAARLKLREDLRFTLHQTGRTSWYVIEDELNSKFYRIGRAEYVFLSTLDGTRTVQSALAATAAELEADAFSEAEAGLLCKWLVDNELAETGRSDQQRWREAREKRQFAKRIQWLNPIMIKVPLGNPDRLVTWLSRYVGWMVSGSTLFVGIVIAAVAGLFLASSHEALFSPERMIVARDNWFRLGCAWLALRVIHELAHAVTCKRFGGTVREWGVLLLLFIPLPYVDVTSAWRFPERLPRVLTSAAGMIAELFLASIAGLVWFHCEPGLVRQSALNIIFAAGFTTILFNANPLMRFDGYHMLADLCGIPNLWTHGRQFVRSIGRRWFLGLKVNDPPWRPEHAFFIRLYGITSFVWTTLVFVSISVAASALVDGVGLLLAMSALLLWVGLPIARLVKFLLVGTETEQPNRLRFFGSVLGLAVGVVALGISVPAPSVLTAPVVVEYDPISVVRARTGGFIREVHFVPGETVAAQAKLCTLENRELELELAETRLQLEQSELRLRRLKSDGDPSGVQFERQATRDLRRRVTELQSAKQDLVVRSPVSGQVIGSDLRNLVHTYVKVGTELTSVGSLEGKQLTALIPQADAQSLLQKSQSNADSFRDSGTSPEPSVPLAATIRIWGRSAGVFSGRVTRINPRAQTRLPHFSFASATGGPLAVVQTDVSEGTRADSASNAWELATPHVAIVIRLDDPGLPLYAGQQGLASLRIRKQSLANYCYDLLVRYFRKHIQRTHGL